MYITLELYCIFSNNTFIVEGCQIELFFYFYFYLVTKDGKDHLLLDKGAVLGRDHTQITGVCSSTNQKRAIVAAIQICHPTDSNYYTLFEMPASMRIHYT